MSRKMVNSHISTALIIIVFLFVFCVIMAYFYVDYRSKHYNYENIEIKFEKTNFIEISNELPLSDKLGKEYNGSGSKDGIQGYMYFSLKNSNTVNAKYDIYVTKIDFDNNIEEQFVKLYLTDDNDRAYDGFNNSVPLFSSLPVLEYKKDSKLLYSGEIAASASKNFKLRVWLSDSSDLSDSYKKFKFNVDVKTKY